MVPCFVNRQVFPNGLAQLEDSHRLDRRAPSDLVVLPECAVTPSRQADRSGAGSAPSRRADRPTVAAPGGSLSRCCLPDAAGDLVSDRSLRKLGDSEALSGYRDSMFEPLAVAVGIGRTAVPVGFESNHALPESSDGCGRLVETKPRGHVGYRPGR